MATALFLPNVDTRKFSVLPPALSRGQYKSMPKNGGKFKLKKIHPNHLADKSGRFPNMYKTF